MSSLLGEDTLLNLQCMPSFLIRALFFQRPQRAYKDTVRENAMFEEYYKVQFTFTHVCFNLLLLAFTQVRVIHSSAGCWVVLNFYHHIQDFLFEICYLLHMGNFIPYSIELADKDLQVAQRNCFCWYLISLRFTVFFLLIMIVARSVGYSRLC